LNIPVEAILTDPRVAAAVVIQFLMGLGLGYFAVKALKYIAAFIAILVLGSFLSVWSLGGSIESSLQTLGELAGAVKSLLTVLGVLTVGPVLVGFIVGVLISLLRK
jgi:hypothetical protein